MTISSKQLYIEVAMEDRGTVQKRITATTTGNVADGCAVGEVAIVTTNLLKISGPSSVTSRIDTVEATINVEGMNSDITDTVVPVLYDVDGNVIDTTKLKMSLNTVTVSAQILKIKDVPVEFATTGNVAKDYMIKGIEYSPRTVRLKGEAAVLNTVNKVSVPAEVLDVTGAVADVATTVDISSYLPDGISLVLASDAKVEVKVKIEAMVKKSFEIPVSALTVENLPETEKINFLLEDLTVEIAGAESDMKKLSAEDIKGTVDVSGLEEGEHKVVVTLLLDANLYQTTSTITIPVYIGDGNVETTEEITETETEEDTADSKDAAEKSQISDTAKVKEDTSKKN